MFVPGAAKYFGIDGLLSLCAPHGVVVAGTSELAVAKRVFAASGSMEQLRLADEAGLSKLISEQMMSLTAVAVASVPPSVLQGQNPPIGEKGRVGTYAGDMILVLSI